MKGRGLTIVLGIVVVALFLSPLLTFGGEGRTYVVKKGDTLWDISARFFGDPMKWPDLWEKNRFLTNPNYIYPGLELTIEPPAPKKEEFVVYIKEPEPEAKPVAEKEVQEEAPEKPAPQKVYLTRKEILAGGELYPGEPPRVGRIIETTEEKVAFSPGDRVYLELEKDYSPGTVLGIFRVEGPVYVSGYSGDAYKNRYIGSVRVDEKFDGRYLGTIVELLEEALRTDYLEEEIPAVPEIVPRYAQDGLKGEVVVGAFGNYEFAEGDILYTKGGKKEGFSVGDVVNIYLPLESLQKLTVSQVSKGLKKTKDFVYVARGIVIRVNELFSTVYVVDSVNSFNSPALVVRGEV